MSTLASLISQILGFGCIIFENACKAWMTSEGNTKEEVQMDCCVCLCRLQEGDGTRKLPCHHLFHRECVDQWLVRCQRTCPLCRLSIDAEPLFAGESSYNDELVIWFSTFLAPGY
ncbi:hypothetical protein HPP92_020733 [Vanilla planifolia]|nr:hypothetical protein HPP92_020733 [Vanilla planifolia]